MAGRWSLIYTDYRGFLAVCLDIRVWPVWRNAIIGGCGRLSWVLADYGFMSYDRKWLIMDRRLLGISQDLSVFALCPDKQMPDNLYYVN